MGGPKRGKLSALWERFRLVLEPKTNYRLNRHHLQKQAAVESIDEDMTQCKQKTKKCQFRDNIETKEKLVEQLVVGIKHPALHEKLLSHDSTLTIDGEWIWQVLLGLR